MSAFARHGIDHLSISSLNLFASEPALWVMERLLGRRGPVGAAAHRGTAAEAGIALGLLDPDLPVADCQAYAVKVFDELTALSRDARVEKERTGVPSIVWQGLERLRPRGAPTATQQEIRVMLPGCPLPWLGYVDLFYADHAPGVVVDIKSTLRLPSEPSTGHARQVSLYTYNTPYAAKIAYFTPGRSEVYEIGEEAKQQHIADLVNIAGRLERFLGLSDDPAVLASVVVPDVDSFYYADPVTRALAKEVFGL